MIHRVLLEHPIGTGTVKIPSKMAGLFGTVFWPPLIKNIDPKIKKNGTKSRISFGLQFFRLDSNLILGKDILVCSVVYPETREDTQIH